MRRSGWLTFSAVIMIIAGIMRVLDGIWAFRYKGTPVDNLHQAIFGDSLTTYAWIWVIVGAILIMAGLLVMGEQTLGSVLSRWIGVVAAGIMAITAASWLAYYPVWSLVYIGLSVLVIYGLLAHYDDRVGVAGG
jgi:uncharacterized membrane protein HdeD (DUF308 family)